MADRFRMSVFKRAGREYFEVQWLQDGKKRTRSTKETTKKLAD